MEKIYKLLTSKNKEDATIGFLLLLSHPSEDILKFFKENQDHPAEPGAYTIKTGLTFEENPIPQQIYIDIGTKYRFVKASGDFRLRDISSDGYVFQHQIISKENFINGVY